MKNTPKTAPVKAQKQKNSALDIFLDICLVACICYWIWDLFLSYPIMDSIAAKQYEPETGLISAISSIELTERGERILRASQPVLNNADDFNAACVSDMEKNVTTLGCFDVEEKRIHIYEIENEELQGIRESVLLHETLHAVYARLNFIDRMLLDNELRAFHEANPDFEKEYLENYTEDILMSELHSIIGQRVKAEDMPEALRKHYQDYIKDIDHSVSFYHKYTGRLSEIRAKIGKYDAEIKEMRKISEEKRTTYRKNYDKVEEDIRLHNYRIETNTYYTSDVQANNMASYLKARQRAVEEERVALNSYIDEMNQKIREMNTLIEHYRDIYAVMDNRGEKQSEVESVDKT